VAAAHTVALGRFGRELLLDVLDVALDVERARRGKAREEVEGVEQRLGEPLLEVGVGEHAVPIDAPCPQRLRHGDPIHAHKWLDSPVVEDVAAVHHLAEEVAQVVPRHLGVVLQVVDAALRAVDEVARGEGVDEVEADRAELLALQYTRAIIATLLRRGG
jgi:hypothetical protein